MGKCLVHFGRTYILVMVSGNEARKRVRRWMTTQVMLVQVKGHIVHFR